MTTPAKLLRPGTSRLLMIAVLVAACSPLPPAPVSPSAVATAPVPRPTPQDDPTGPPIAAITPAPTPAATPVPLKGHRLVLPGPPDGGVELMIRDWSGTLAGVEAADPSLVDLPDPGPHRLAIGPGTSERRVTVAWTGGICDTWLTLAVAADAHTLALHEPQRPGCDAMGIGRSVEIRFEGPVDATAFSGTIAMDAISVTDINPTLVAFADPIHGWVAGTIERGEAVIEETRDGGVTWAVTSLGAGTVSDIAVSGDGAVAARLCPEAAPDCGAGLFRQDRDGDWTPATDDRPMALDFEGNDGIGAFLVAGRRNENGMPMPDVRVTDDGLSWVAVDNPCGRMNLDDVAIGPDSGLFVLCTGEGAGGGQRKAMYRAAAAGEPWKVLATTEAQSLPMGGTGMRFDLADDGHGWMWGVGTRLLATSDDGATWHAVAGPADGEVAMAVGAVALGDGAGYQLVVDGDGTATSLYWTPDGVAWQPRFAWPIHAECCG